MDVIKTSCMRSSCGTLHLVPRWPKICETELQVNDDYGSSASVSALNISEVFVVRWLATHDQAVQRNNVPIVRQTFR